MIKVHDWKEVRNILDDFVVAIGKFKISNKNKNYKGAVKMTNDNNVNTTDDKDVVVKTDLKDYIDRSVSISNTNSFVKFLLSGGLIVGAIVWFAYPSDKINYLNETNVKAISEFKIDTKANFVKVDNSLSTLNVELTSFKADNKADFKSLNDLIIKKQEENQAQYEKLWSL